MKKVLLSIIAFFTLCVANAQWESLNGPVGDGVSSLIESGNDLLLSTYNGIFRSSDGGEHWQVEDNELRGINISTLIRQNDTLFAYSAATKMLYRSSDEGEHWQSIISTNLTPYVFHQLVATDSALFFNDTKIKRSFDGGFNWTVLAFPAPLQYYYTRMYVQGNTLYVVAPDQGIYKSEDQGDTWALLTGNLALKPRWGFVYEGGLLAGYYSNGWKIYRSKNDGLSWSINPDPGIGLGFSFFGTDEEYLYAGFNGELWRSPINGNIWSFVSGASFLGQTNVPITNYVKFYSIQDQLFATSYAGVHRSSDQGENWKDVENGIVNVGIRDILVRHKTAVCAGYSGLYRLSEQGLWSGDLSDQFPISDNQVLRLSEIEGDFYAGAKWKIYRSVDTGQTWQAASPFWVDYFTQAIKVGNDVVAATSQGIWRTSNGGATWVHSSEGMGYIDIDIEVFPFLEALIQVGDTLLTSGNSMFFRSTDGGYHWQIVDSFLNGRRLYCFDNQVFLVSAYNVYRSTDSGASWQTVDFNHPDGVNSMARTDSFYFAGTRGGVLVSKDKGYTWHFSGGNFPESLWTTGLSADDEYLYAGTAGEGVWRRQLDDFVSDVDEQQISAQNFRASLVENPVSDLAIVQIVLTESSQLSLSVFNLEGRLVRQFYFDEKNAGDHFLPIDLNGLPPAVYQMVVQVGETTSTFSAIKQ